MAHSDAELVERTRRGEAGAFGELYDRHAPLVRAICADATGELAAAQDLAQEVFLRAFERLAELRTAQAFGPWVVGIARLASKEWRRRRMRDRQRCGAELTDVAARPAAADERLETLLALLADMPEPERQALHAFYLEEHSAERGAAALGLSRSGFYKLLESARQILALRFRQTQEDR